MVSGKSKAQFLSDVLNKTVAEVVTRCSKAEGVRNYFEVGVVAYSDDMAREGWGGGLRGSILHPISKIAETPLRIEDRVKNLDDGVGGIVEQKVKFPVWFEPASVGGTPMKAGLTKAAEILADWCDAHRSCYPPTIFHITDGQSTDGDPEDVANVIRQLATDDGQVLLFSLHIDTGSGNEISFPTSESILPDQYSRQLFRMSSLFPPSLIEAAQSHAFQPSSARIIREILSLFQNDGKSNHRRRLSYC